MNLLLPLSIFLVMICIAMICSLGRGRQIQIAYVLNLAASIVMIIISSFVTEFVVGDVIYISSIKIRYILLFGSFNILGAFINGYKDSVALQVSIQSSFLYIGGIILFGAKSLVTFYLAYTLIFIIVTILPSIGNRRYELTRNYLSEIYIGMVLMLGIVLFLGATDSLWLEALPTKKYIFTLSYVCFFIVLCFRLGVFPFHLQKKALFNIGGGKAVGIDLIGQLMSNIAILLLVGELYGKVDQALKINMTWIITVLAVMSAFYGQIKGMFQRKMRNILNSNLAAQASYILVVILLFTIAEREKIVALYLVQLMISMTGLKIFLNKVSVEENKMLGLFYRDKWIAIALTVLLVNLAGLPFTAGYVVRYKLFLELAMNEKWFLLVSFTISFIFGFTYLIREVVRIYSKRQIDSHCQNYIVLSGTEKLALIVLAIFLLIAGLVPNIFI